MGSGGTVICKDCTEQFDIMNGEGMESIVLTCNKCGIQKMVPLSEDKQKDNCTCTGEFLYNAIAKCPNCRSSDYEYITFINWD